MRHILPIYQNTDAWNGLSQEDNDIPERAEEIAARWPDAQHWGMEIRALMRSGGEEG
jgi:hypothetical protein